MWQVVPGQSLRCREWGGEAVLYNDVSGSTHLLDGAAADVLRALSAAPADAPQLAALLAGQLDADGGDLVPLIDDVLAALARLDLVERC
jgi:PqqD family protein of HPr-rel-A system